MIVIYINCGRGDTGGHWGTLGDTATLYSALFVETYYIFGCKHQYTTLILPTDDIYSGQIIITPDNNIYSYSIYLL